MHVRLETLRKLLSGQAVCFSLGLALGLTLAIAAFAASGPGTVGGKVARLLQPSRATELDWRLTQVRLNQVEEQVNELSNSGSASCCAAYWYDPTKDKIVARFRYAPDTLNRLTVQEAKQKLRQAAMTASAAAAAEIEQGPGGVTLGEQDFEVEFVTWDEHAKFKTFAVYRNGEVELVDKALK